MKVMQRCETCRFWSDKLAQALGGPLEAYCLSGDGPFHDCQQRINAGLTVRIHYVRMPPT